MERKEAIEIARKLYNESLFMKKDREAMLTLIPELAESEVEKKYKEALERAREELGSGCFDRGTVEYIFPELKESEDDKMRTMAIKAVYSPEAQSCIKSLGINPDDVIDWLGKQSKCKPVISYDALREGIAHFGITQYQIDNWLKKYVDVEKQGEQNQKHLELKAGHWYFCHQAYCCRADHLTVKEGERFMCEEDGVVKGFVIKNPEKYFKEVCAPAPIDDEQKPFDKNQTKFKIGDWVVNNDGSPFSCGENTLQITDIEGEEIWLESKTWTTGESIHLWTIADAKDGDVLAEDSCMFIIEKMKSEGMAIVHCCLFDDGDFDLIGSTLCFDADSTYPATKEQCDLLFQKMKEAGYEWDAEKKELKKIEQKPDWGEEDEKMENLIIKTLTSMGTLNLERYYHMNLDEVKKWLKSIKDRVQL